MSGAEQLLQLLQGCLTSDHSTRQQCEKALTDMEAHAGYGPALLEIAVHNQTNMAIRQLAAVLLKSYVKKNWDPKGDEGIVYHPVPAADRDTLRARLVSGLSDPEPRMRTAFSMAISVIARCDFPELWPSLPEELTRLLHSDNEAAVNGAVRCLAIFSDDISIEQLPQFVNLGIFPALVQFALIDNQPLQARGCAVHVLRSTLSLLRHLDKSYKKAAIKTLQPMLESWISMFATIINTPDDPTASCVVKVEALQGIRQLVLSVPKVAAPLMPALMGVIWENFVRALPLYEQHFLNTPDPVDPIQGPDGQNEGFIELVLSYIELFKAMMEAPKLAQMIRGNVRQVVDILLAYMQITDQQCSLWADDITQYVEDEDEEGLGGDLTVRMAAIDLVASMSDVYEELLIQAVGLSAVKRVEDSDIVKKNNNPRWWKYREAAYMALSASEDGFLSHMSEVEVMQQHGEQVKPVFDLIGFINATLLPDFAVTEPFLKARVLSTAGCFGQYVHPESLPAVIGELAKALNDPQASIAVHICACKAFSSMKSNLKDPEVLKPHAAAIVAGCCALLPKTDETSLMLVLMTMEQALKVNPLLIQEHHAALVPAMLTVWMREFRDYFNISSINEILLFIVSNAGPQLIHEIHNIVLPTCIQVMSNPAGHPEELMWPIVELLIAMLKPASEPTALVQQCVGLLIELCKRSQEDTILQSGAQCLAVVVRQFGAHLTGALPEIMAVLQHLLEPQMTDSARMHLGTLTVQLIRTFPNDMGPHLKDLLTAILTRLHDCKLPTIIQNLIIIFAQLARMDTKQVLDLVATIDFGGTSGLEVLFHQWARWGTEIHGMYPRKVHLQALAQFYMLEDPRLVNLQVPFQEIVDTSSSIRTRSAAKKAGQAVDQWSKCPLPVKIIMIFAHTLQFYNIAARKNQDDDVLSDDSDFEDAGIEIGGQGAFAKNEMQFLADILDFDALDDSDDEGGMEEDVTSIGDPINDVKPEEMILDFLRTVYQKNGQFFAQAVGALPADLQEEVRISM